MFLLLNLIHFGVVIFPLAIVFSHSLSIDLLLLMTPLVYANISISKRYIRLLTWQSAITNQSFVLCCIRIVYISHDYSVFVKIFLSSITDKTLLDLGLIKVKVGTMVPFGLEKHTHLYTLSAWKLCHSFIKVRKLFLFYFFFFSVWWYISIID